VREVATALGSAASESAPELPVQRGPDLGEQRALFELPAQPEHPQESAPGEPASPELQEADTAAPPPSLGVRECAVLDFERKQWKRVGAKEEAIRAQFGISPTNYFQILNALLDDPAALAYSPTLVGRLRRRREARAHARR
jgi:Protein of unknown function (DUF3263)